MPGEWRQVTDPGVTEPGLQAGSPLTQALACACAVTGRPCSVSAPPERSPRRHRWPRGQGLPSQGTSAHGCPWPRRSSRTRDVPGSPSGAAGVRLGVVLAAARAGQAAVTRPGTAPGQAAVPGLDPPPEGIPQTNPPGSKRWNPPPRYIKTMRVPPTLPETPPSPAGHLAVVRPGDRVRLGLVLAAARARECRPS
jgi:hypothetical protein